MTVLWSVFAPDVLSYNIRLRLCEKKNSFLPIFITLSYLFIRYIRMCSCKVEIYNLSKCFWKGIIYTSWTPIKYCLKSSSLNWVRNYRHWQDLYRNKTRPLITSDVYLNISLSFLFSVSEKERHCKSILISTTEVCAQKCTMKK